MRIVCDPNVLVSAAVATGVCAELIDRWLTEPTGSFELVVCPVLIGELGEVLSCTEARKLTCWSRVIPT